MPYVTPPLTLSVGGGPARNVPPAKPERSHPINPSPAFDVRLGVAPLGLVRELNRRPLDPSMGLIIQGGGPSAFVGAFGGLDWFLWQSSAEPSRWRLKTFASADYARGEQTDLTTFGASLGVGIEHAEFLGLTPIVSADDESEESGSAIVGVAYGEWAIGFSLGMTYRTLPGQDLWMGYAALTFRLPASAGIICCFRSGDD